MAKPPNSQGSPKRRILFIEKTFQLKFIAKVTAVIVLGTALTGGLLYLLADQEFGRAFFSAHYQARSSWELLLPSVLISSFVAMCLVAAVAVVLTLYDSHRIGGPLFRFKSNLQTVGDGDLTTFTKLREKDELKPFTDSMNEMTAKLREKILRIKTAHEEIKACVGKLNPEGDATAAKILGELNAAEKKLAEALSAFRVEK